MASVALVALSALGNPNGQGMNGYTGGNMNGLCSPQQSIPQSKFMLHRFSPSIFPFLFGPLSQSNLDPSFPELRFTI